MDLTRGELETALVGANAREVLESAFLIALASWDGKGPITFSVRARGAEAIEEMEQAVKRHAREVRAQPPPVPGEWRKRHGGA